MTSYTCTGEEMYCPHCERFFLVPSYYNGQRMYVCMNPNCGVTIDPSEPTC